MAANDRRHYTPAPVRSSELPLDYVKMVEEILSANFDAGLKTYSELVGAETRFKVTGGIFPDEVLVRVTLITTGKIAATTFHASTDFDPKASSPKVDQVLGACVDGIGALLGHFLDETKPKMLAQLADESASALEEAPFEWSPQEVDRFKVFMKIDKLNPVLDSITDDWLAKNDPKHAEHLQEEREEVESLFVSGPRKPTDVH